MQRDIKATRRDLLKAMAAWTAAATRAGCSNNSWLRQLAQSGFSGSAAQSWSDLRPWARYPEKTDLLMLADRPPLLETPLHHFLSDLTPNDAYFVRWHYAGLPTSIDLRTFLLSVAGAVTRPLQLRK
jgi:DMSO/TMAO reductase YedYZ molybdopterin-dependent catalytic subunit